MKEIKYSQLIRVFHKICQLSMIEQSGNSSSWDLDLSIPFLKESGLDKNIVFVSRSHKKLPLNSERHLYDINNMVVKKLHIDLDDRSVWEKYDDWKPLNHAKWHFENCRFVPSVSYAGLMHFAWMGSFRFYKNVFEFQSRGIIGSCLVGFGNGSRVMFQVNDFKGNSIQTRCFSVAEERAADVGTNSNPHSSGRISFMGNKGISSLGILEGYASVALTGMNRIGQLWFHPNLDDGTAQELSVYLGPREKIDPDFDYCLQHRNLFTSMRRKAALNQDTRQLNILDKQLERIEYHMNKEQDTPSLFDFRIWIEYWQDRLLYGWRRWSSNFYRSWIRPLLMIVLGYMLLNAAPALFIDSFLLSEWFEFTFRPLGQIAVYEESLRDIVGYRYQDVSSAGKNALRVVGVIEVVWIAMWSFAFARSIRR